MSLHPSLEQTSSRKELGVGWQGTEGVTVLAIEYCVVFEGHIVSFLCNSVISAIV